MLLQPSTKCSTEASTGDAPHSWPSLPTEIRLMILEAIAQQKHPGWASFASVCKDWQLVLARQNFRQLTLHVPCLDGLEHLMVRHRHLVQYIRFEIELPPYSCHRCDRPAGPSMTNCNTAIISKGIMSLFRILSSWDSTGRPCPNSGLSLELNVHCPSDSKHWFKNYQFALDDGKGNGRKDDNIWDDPRHGWVKGQQVTAPPAFAILGLFQQIQLQSVKDLPEVKCVTSLIIGRQLRRQLQLSGFEALLDKLSGLEHLLLEPWKSWEYGARAGQETCTCFLCIFSFSLLHKHDC